MALTSVLVVLGMLILVIILDSVSGDSLPQRGSVSIIMVTHNHADVVEGIVRGLCWLAVSLNRSVQIILIDNNSEDGTNQVNRLLSKDYAQVMAVEVKDHQGIDNPKSLAALYCLSSSAYFCLLPVGVSRLELLPLFHQLLSKESSNKKLDDRVNEKIYIKDIIIPYAERGVSR